MSQFGSIQQIGQVAFNPAAAPVETYTVPLAGQPLAGNNLQQIAEALAPMSPALNRFAGAILEVEREQAAMEGAGIDFSTIQLSQDIEANEKAFRDMIAKSGSPNAANPYFLVGARKAYGRQLAREYESEVLALKDTLTAPFDAPNYDEATASLKQKYRDALGNNIWSVGEFGLAAKEVDSRISRRFFEEQSQKMEAAYVADASVRLSNQIIELRNPTDSKQMIDTINGIGQDFFLKGVDFQRTLKTTVDTVFNDPNISEDDIDAIMPDLMEVRVGNTTVANNAALRAELRTMADGAKKSKEDWQTREMNKVTRDVSYALSVTLPRAGFGDLLEDTTEEDSFIIERGVQMYRDDVEKRGQQVKPEVEAAIRQGVIKMIDSRRQARVESDDLRSRIAEERIMRNLEYGLSAREADLVHLNKAGRDRVAAIQAMGVERSKAKDIITGYARDPITVSYALGYKDIEGYPGFSAVDIQADFNRDADNGMYDLLLSLQSVTNDDRRLEVIETWVSERRKSWMEMHAKKVEPLAKAARADLEAVRTVEEKLEGDGRFGEAEAKKLYDSMTPENQRKYRPVLFPNQRPGASVAGVEGERIASQITETTPIIDDWISTAVSSQPVSDEEMTEKLDSTAKSLSEVTDKRIEALGGNTAWKRDQTQLVEAIKTGTPIFVDGWIFDSTVSPQAAEFMYLSIRRLNGYDISEYVSVGDGATDKNGIRFPTNIDPFRTSFAASPADIEQMKKLGLQAAKDAFPMYIETQEEFDDMVFYQERLMMLRNKMSEPVKVGQGRTNLWWLNEEMKKQQQRAEAETKKKAARQAKP